MIISVYAFWLFLLFMIFTITLNYFGKYFIIYFIITFLHVLFNYISLAIISIAKVVDSNYNLFYLKVQIINNFKCLKKHI